MSQVFRVQAVVEIVWTRFGDKQRAQCLVTHISPSRVYFHRHRAKFSSNRNSRHAARGLCYFISLHLCLSLARWTPKVDLGAHSELLQLALYGRGANYKDDFHKASHLTTWCCCQSYTKGERERPEFKR